MTSDFFAPTIEFMRFESKPRIEQPHVETVRLRVGVSAFAIAALVLTSSAAFSSPAIASSTLRTADYGSHRTNHRERALTNRIARVAESAHLAIPEGEPPLENAIAQAYVFAQQIADEVQVHGLTWVEPNVAANPFGELVFEWWRGTRKLTLYFNGSRVEYVRSAGADIDADMKDGTVRSPGHWVSLWQWLHSKQALRTQAPSETTRSSSVVS